MGLRDLLQNRPIIGGRRIFATGAAPSGLYIKNLLIGVRVGSGQDEADRKDVPQNGTYAADGKPLVLHVTMGGPGNTNFEIRLEDAVTGALTPGDYSSNPNVVKMWGDGQDGVIYATPPAGKYRVRAYDVGPNQDKRDPAGTWAFSLTGTAPIDDGSGTTDPAPGAQPPSQPDPGTSEKQGLFGLGFLPVKPIKRPGIVFKDKP